MKHDPTFLDDLEPAEPPTYRGCTSRKGESFGVWAPRIVLLLALIVCAVGFKGCS